MPAATLAFGLTRNLPSNKRTVRRRRSRPVGDPAIVHQIRSVLDIASLGYLAVGLATR